MKKIVDVVLEINEKFILPLENVLKLERKKKCMQLPGVKHALLDPKSSVLSNTPTVPH